MVPCHASRPSPRHLARPLAEGLRLGCPVRAIHLHDASVDVVALDQVRTREKSVVAVPPTAYNALGFTPPLPDDIAEAAASFAPGTVVKYLLRYERPFWLENGRNGGLGQFLGPPGLYPADASLPDVRNPGGLRRRHDCGRVDAPFIGTTTGRRHRATHVGDVR